MRSSSNGVARYLGSQRKGVIEMKFRTAAGLLGRMDYRWNPLLGVIYN